MLGACAARGGEADGKDAGEETVHTSRNAFIEVTAPPGQRVKWVSENDFAIVGNRRAETGKVTVRARPDWKLTKPSAKDGVMEFAPVVMMAYSVASDLGEDGGDGEGYVCSEETTVVTNHISASVISVTNMTATAGEVLVPSMGITSTPVNLGAVVNIISNGLHKIVTTTTPCFVCTGGEPEERVTTSELNFTPSSFKWNWQAEKNSGTKVGGPSFSTNAIVASPGRHPVVISAASIGIPDCCASSAASQTNALVVQITTKTVASTPLPRTRLKLGVREEVDITLLPSDLEGITWTAKGGSVDRDSGPEVTFKAQADSGQGEVTVSFADDGEASVGFGIIRPSFMVFENGTFNDWRSPATLAGKNNQRFRISYHARLYVMPDDVNFYNIVLAESDSQTYGQTLPYFSGFPVHQANGPHRMTMDVIPGKGTESTCIDEISGAAASPIKNSQQLPFDNASVWWSIDWRFRLRSSESDNDYTTINNVTQNFEIEVTDPNMNLVIFRITKAQSGAQIGSSDLAPMFITP